MEPKVSPPGAGGMARSAGVVTEAEIYTSVDHPVCSQTDCVGSPAATPPILGGEILGVRGLIRGESEC
jgi:hypothetical protein